MIVFVMLSVLTSLYFLFASKQDLQERMIYTVPILVLHAMWSMYLCCMTDWTSSSLCTFWVIHLILYILLNSFRIWGGGDSDLLLLFANLCLIAGPVTSPYVVILRECLCLCIGLAIAIGIGYVETKRKGMDMERHREIAVVPGLALVGILLMIKGFVWRFV